MLTLQLFTPPCTSTLTIAQDAYRAATAHGNRTWRFNLQTLLAACRHFYGQHLAAEQNNVMGLSGAVTVYKALADYARQLPEHAVLIRLGFGTGRDSKTLNYLQPEPLRSVSRLLVDGEWPLGWMEMRVLTEAGNPFTPADDVTWKEPVPPLVNAPRRTLAAEESRAQAERARRETERRREERTSKLASDFMTFLRSRQGGDEEEDEE